MATYYNSVTELSATTGALVQVISGAPYDFDSPYDIATNGTNVWVTNSSGDSVTEFPVLLSPTTPTISNLPAAGTYGGGFTAVVGTNGDGTTSVTSSTPLVCGANGLTVTYVGVGTCTLTAHVAAGTDYAAADGNPQSFSVGQGTPTTPSISNLPAAGTYGGGFTALVGTNGDGTTSVTSSAPLVCGANGLTVTYVGVGTCTLTAHVAAGTNYGAADGNPQSFSVGQGTPTMPSISNLPAAGIYGGGFTALVGTNGDGTTSVTSSTLPVCTVGANGLAVSYVGVGTCTLTAHVAAGTDYGAADGSPQSFSVGRAPQTISFTGPGSGGVGGFATLSASGGASGNPVVFSVDPSSGAGVCKVTGTNGTTVNYTVAGTCVIDANQAGNADYLRQQTRSPKRSR